MVNNFFSVQHLDNKYINSAGDSMNGVLAINPYIKFPDDSEQSTAYGKNIFQNDKNPAGRT